MSRSSAPDATFRRRRTLNRDRVVQAAVALADTQGIDSLTMRALAKDLGVQPMALYNHVDDKDDLVDAMIERAASTIELPEDGLPWRSHAMHRATSAHRVLMRHAWLAPVWTSRISLGPARMAYMDCALRSLRLAGFSGVLLDRTYHAIENHIIGHALQSVGFPLDAEGMKVMGPAFLRAFPVEQYPDLGAHIRHHLESTEPSSAEEEFRFGLDLILDGLERLRTV